jgi:hypothetical protein
MGIFDVINATMAGDYFRRKFTSTWYRRSISICQAKTLMTTVKKDGLSHLFSI